MYCRANASLFRSLKILVDNQDNSSIPIKNSPRQRHTFRSIQLADHAIVLPQGWVSGFVKNEPCR
jgi:hypothetical protein